MDSYGRLEYQENPDTFLHLVRSSPISDRYISSYALLKAKSLLLKGRYQLEIDSIICLGVCSRNGQNRMLSLAQHLEQPELTLYNRVLASQQSIHPAFSLL
jgi:hypothetical protein